MEVQRFRYGSEHGRLPLLQSNLSDRFRQTVVLIVGAISPLRMSSGQQSREGDCPVRFLMIRTLVGRCETSVLQAHPGRQSHKPYQVKHAESITSERVPVRPRPV